MSTTKKCQAKGGVAACTDPRCPEKVAHEKNVRNRLDVANARMLTATGTTAYSKAEAERVAALKEWQETTETGREEKRENDKLWQRLRAEAKQRRTEEDAVKKAKQQVTRKNVTSDPDSLF